MATQKDRVLKRLKERGYITRNECLGTYPAISRLGAIICQLKKEGYEIEGKDEGNDYAYKIDIKPVAKPQVVKINGEFIAIIR